MDTKELADFYRHFHDSEAALKEQIYKLQADYPSASKRQEDIDAVLTGIKKLQNEVADAADFTPSYDRRQYSESIKSLHELLNNTTSRLTPRTRFQFKRTARAPAGDNDPRHDVGSSAPSRESRAAGASDNPGLPHAAASVSIQKDGGEEAPSTGKNYNIELREVNSSTTRRPSFSSARSISISNQTGLHIVLPSTAAVATAAGSLTNLQRCLVDMALPTGGPDGKPLPGFAIKNVKDSVIVAGRVSGPVHITSVKNSVLVIVARQVRIHECRGVDLYLQCGSHPIIEDCSEMRFAPLPSNYETEDYQASENQWDQVDDFKWLKAGRSPNWSVLNEDKRLPGRVWAGVASEDLSKGVNEKLAEFGILE